MNTQTPTGKQTTIESIDQRLRMLQVFESEQKAILEKNPGRTRELAALLTLENIRGQRENALWIRSLLTRG